MIAKNNGKLNTNDLKGEKTQGNKKIDRLHIKILILILASMLLGCHNIWVFHTGRINIKF